MRSQGEQTTEPWCTIVPYLQSLGVQPWLPVLTPVRTGAEPTRDGAEVRGPDITGAGSSTTSGSGVVAAPTTAPPATPTAAPARAPLVWPVATPPIVAPARPPRAAPPRARSPG